MSSFIWPGFRLSVRPYLLKKTVGFIFLSILCRANRQKDGWQASRGHGYDDFFEIQLEGFSVISDYESDTMKTYLFLGWCPGKRLRSAYKNGMSREVSDRVSQRISIRIIGCDRDRQRLSCFYLLIPNGGEYRRTIVVLHNDNDFLPIETCGPARSFYY